MINRYEKVDQLTQQSNKFKMSDLQDWTSGDLFGYYEYTNRGGGATAVKENSHVFFTINMICNEICHIRKVHSNENYIQSTTVKYW